jgi:hypothetical protein
MSFDFKSSADVYAESIMKLNKAVGKLADSQKTLLDATKAIANNQQAATKAAKGLQQKTSDLTAAQKKLGVVTASGGQYFNKAKERVDKYGTRLTKTGDAVTKFNKRTAVLNTSVKTLSNQNEKFNLGMKSFKAYTDAGGNSLEYFAEFLSSTREEVTVFGVEAGKARKVMYGFLPPGMFRLMNKLSSSFQLFGGFIRRSKDSGSGLDKQLEKLTETLAETEKGGEDYVNILAKIKALQEDAVPDNIFTNVIKGYTKFKKVLTGKTSVDELKKGIVAVHDAYDEMFKKRAFVKKSFLEGQNVTKAAEAMKELTDAMADNNNEIYRMESQIADAFAMAEMGIGSKSDALNKQIEINALIHKQQEKQIKIQDAINKQEAKGQGMKVLQNKIHAKKILIKQSKKEIDASKNAIFQERANLKAIRKKWNADPSSVKNFAKKTEKAKKIIAAEKTKIGTKKDTIDTAKGDMKGLKEQTGHLKELKAAATMKLLDKFPILKKVYKTILFFGGLGPMIRMVLKGVFMGMIYFGIALVGLLVIAKAFGPQIKEGLLTAWKAMAKFKKAFDTVFELLWGGIKMVLNSIFGDGTIAEAVEGLVTIAIGLAGVLLLVAVAIITGFVALWWGILKATIERYGEWLNRQWASFNADIPKYLAKAAIWVGLIVAAIALVLLMLPFIPVWGAIALGVVLLAGVAKVIDYMSSKLNWFADGGVASGLSVVGEKGPELVNFGKPSRVHSNADSKKMIGGGGTVNNFNITINAKDTSDTEMRRIADKIGNMVSNKINRRTSSGTMS